MGVLNQFPYNLKGVKSFSLLFWLSPFFRRLSFLKSVSQTGDFFSFYCSCSSADHSVVVAVAVHLTPNQGQSCFSGGLLTACSINLGNALLPGMTLTQLSYERLDSPFRIAFSPFSAPLIAFCRSQVCEVLVMKLQPWRNSLKGVKPV